MNDDNLMGIGWEAIQAKQRKEESYQPRTVSRSPEAEAKWKQDIENDIRRRFPVADAGVSHFGIAMPDGYELEDGIWRFI